MVAEDQLRQVVDRVVPVALQVTQTEVDPPQVVPPPVAVSIDLLLADLQPLELLPAVDPVAHQVVAVPVVVVQVDLSSAHRGARAVDVATVKNSSQWTFLPIRLLALRCQRA